ncbi:MAG: peptidoglycan DD-metalloendopeptidase family protein [Candidatus Muiribacteriaceae bacterium]
MDNTGILRSVDKIINFIIIGIIIQFMFIIMNTYHKDSVHVYSARFDSADLSLFSSPVENGIDDIGENLYVKDSINKATRNVMEGVSDDVLVIKVKTAVENIVEKAEKQMLENTVASGSVDNSGQKDSINIPSIWHRVKKGENLSYIASLYDISLSDLKAINDLNSDMIFTGQKLKISKREGIDYKVEKGDSLWIISKKYHTTIKGIMEANSIDDYKIRVGDKLTIYPGEKWFLKKKRENSKLFIWPLNNKITSPYGYRIHPVYNRKVFHSGVDIRGSIGEPVKSAGDGKVYFAGERNGYGNLVIVRHRDGYETRYAHCSKLMVKKGDIVRKGTLIAKVGNTGVSTGAHLHFEVRKDGKTKNPLKYR